MLKPYFLLLIIFSGTLYYNAFGQKAANDLFQKSEHLFEVGNYAEALNCNIKALKIIEEGGNMAMLAKGNLQVGKMYYFLHEKRLALQYFYKSLAFAEKYKLDSITPRALHNIGAVYVELRENDSALLYLNKAKIVLEKTSNNTDLAKLNAVIADLHLNGTRKFELAKKYIDAAQKYAEKSDDIGWKAFVQIKYSLYYRRINNLQEAINHAKIALALYEKANAVEGKMYGLYVLASTLGLNRDTMSVTVYQEYIQLKDSIFKAETSTKIADYKTLYETEKKEKENKLLQQKNRLDKLEISSKNKTIGGLLISITLIIIIVFWRINVLNLRRKQKELEAQQKLQKERERISRDLHDNVGGQLSYVLFSLEDEEELSIEKRKQKLNDLAITIRSITRNLRETIWTLNQENLTLKSLSDKLKIYTRNMFAYTDTKIKFEENIKNDLDLNPEFALNLFRMCQEILNNSFKHSKASEIHIKVEYMDKVLIQISDNGIGFDKNSISEIKHFGLDNLQKRAQEINSQLSVESEISKGTTISIIV